MRRALDKFKTKAIKPFGYETPNPTPVDIVDRVCNTASALLWLLLIADMVIYAYM